MKLVGQVGVEGDAVAGLEIVALVVDHQRRLAGEHDGRLAGAGLVQRRVARAAGRGAGPELVQRDVGALAGKRRRELLGPVPGAGADPALGGAGDDDVTALVEPQELREGQVEPGRDPLGDRQRRAGLAAFDLREHRRRDAAALGQVAQREVHRLAQSPDPSAE